MKRRKKQNPERCNENCIDCANRFKCKKRVLLGYERLAFGSTADAFRLIMGSECASAAENMDLFNVAEVKKPKDGAMEIKFFDRIKALEHLEQVPGEEKGTTALYEVLNECAGGLKRSDLD